MTQNYVYYKAPFLYLSYSSFPSTKYHLRSRALFSVIRLGYFLTILETNFLQE